MSLCCPPRPGPLLPGPAEFFDHHDLCRFNSLRKPSSMLRHLGNMTGARRTRSGSNTPQLPVEQLPRNPLHFGFSGTKAGMQPGSGSQTWEELGMVHNAAKQAGASALTGHEWAI